MGVAKGRELNASEQLKVFKTLQGRRNSKSFVDTRWALTWKTVHGKKDVRARLAAKGYQGPDLRAWCVGASGRVSLRSSRLQGMPLGASKKLEIRISDVKYALLRADGFGREVIVRAPGEWVSGDARRMWKFAGRSVWA